MILPVCVDDFKLVGKTENLKAGWGLVMGSGLGLDPPTPLGDYMGCGQFPIHVSATEAQRRLEQVMPPLQQVDGIKEVNTGKPVRAICYNMFGFFRQVAEVYCELAGVKQRASAKLPRLALTTTS